MLERTRAAYNRAQRAREQSPVPVLTVAFVAFVVLVPAIPFFTDPWLRVFFLVGVYVLLGLGLNVVVGYAGLLDLGYVAFFAVGAYLMALSTSPASPVDIPLTFWTAVPVAILLGGVVGVILGLPVLPLRGDYLAIVTLGFGEIIRILLVNLRDVTNGSQGLSAVGQPTIGFGEIENLWQWYYVVVGVAIIVAFMVGRLRDSRIGRAWEAIREDEDVAAAMGINTVKYKLMAFAIGAAVGALGGVFFASFIGFVNPTSFSLQVSINVLAIVIIGGMGSTPGVVFGAFVLIGLPDILQFRETSDFLERFGWLRDGINEPISWFNSVSPWNIASLPPSDEWGRLVAERRFIVFGALLVAIIVFRPAGVFPTSRRQHEFEAREATGGGSGGAAAAGEA